MVNKSEMRVLALGSSLSGSSIVEPAGGEEEPSLPELPKKEGLGKPSDPFPTCVAAVWSRSRPPAFQLQGASFAALPGVSSFTHSTRLSQKRCRYLGRPLLRQRGVQRWAR